MNPSIAESIKVLESPVKNSGVGSAANKVSFMVVTMMAVASSG